MIISGLRSTATYYTYIVLHFFFFMTMAFSEADHKCENKRDILMTHVHHTIDVTTASPIRIFYKEIPPDLGVISEFKI